MLLDKLKTYVAGDLYPLHMPGHKRQMGQCALPYDIDLTEVAGVDDLHQAEGILKEAMDRTAALHGAAKTWYLVNGSTCGLLAGVRALAPMGSEILVGRNCHKSVYHAIELGNLTAYYLTPPILKDYSVYGSIQPEAVEESLSEHPGIRCVVITSPTYEGVLSDIKAIAAVCHRFGVPLLVDEAHGAHLGLFPGWPDSAVRSGADLVVQSAHKTLPSLTQTALLHLSHGSLADPQEVERQLDIFETSSPSYPLMASLDACTELLLRDGAEHFTRWRENLEAFDRAILPLKKFKVLGHGGDLPARVYAFDPGKIPVFTGGTQFTGTFLAQALREKFRFETEMACGSLTLAMTSAADSREVLLQFANALLALDQLAEKRPQPPMTLLPEPAKAVCTIAQALLAPSEAVPLDRALGRISAEAVWAYPPGVPMVNPGEEITQALLCCMDALTCSGTRLHHSHCKIENQIQVLS